MLSLLFETGECLKSLTTFVFFACSEGCFKKTGFASILLSLSALATSWAAMESAIVCANLFFIESRATAVLMVLESMKGIFSICVFMG